MRVLRLRCADALDGSGLGYAWAEDDDETLVTAATYAEALGNLLIHLSNVEDLERIGIDLVIEDCVPEVVLDRWKRLRPKEYKPPEDHDYDD